MKNVKYFTFITWLLVGIIWAQDPEKDPLKDSYVIQRGGGEEIVAISGPFVSLYKYFNAFEVAPWDTLIHSLYYIGSSNFEFTDLALADFDNDLFQEIIAVGVTTGVTMEQKVEMVLLKADPARLSIDTIATWQKIEQKSKSSPIIYKSQDWALRPFAAVKTGDLDGDARPEFILAYWADNGQGQGYVNLTVYEVSDSLTISEMGSIMDQWVAEPPEINLCEDQMILFDIECADFNGDGIAEIMLSGRKGLTPAGWSLFTNIYSYDSLSTNLLPKAKNDVFIQLDPLYDIANFNTAAGKFVTSDKASGILGCYQYNPLSRDGGTPDTVSYSLIPFNVSPDLNTLQVGEPFIQLKDTLLVGCFYDRLSVLICKDVNNDSLEEIWSTFSIRANGAEPTFQILKADPALHLSSWADLDHLAEKFNASIVVGNVRTDTTELQPIIEVLVPIQVGSPIYHYTNYMYQIRSDDNGNFSESVFLDSLRTFDWGRSEPVLTGDFDADIRLGKPKRYAMTEIVQPLVVLNAPPIHFDVFDNQNYDISLSYNNNQGQFISHYEKVSSQSKEVETEFTQDWGLSSTLKAGGSYWGVSVSSYLTEKYGERFSTSGGVSTKVTVTIAVDANVDDRIYATTVNYNLWEYPVYGNFGLKGHILVVEPIVVENTWFHSTSWTGYSYIPNHEVGNILSYREYPILSDNPEVDEKIKGDYSTSFVLDNNSSYDWSMTFGDFVTNQVSTSKSYSREWGASVDAWGAGFSISGSYSQEEIYTQRTEVATDLNMNVHLDAIDMGIGEVSYIVTPYAYWSTNGSLVLDYAVRPELAPPGGTPTWWKVRYGDLPDPAFILPWRYYPEKGFALEEEIKRYQTKDLIFLPKDPKEGDIVTIRARIHNFSLIPTPGPMGVRFYINDPDSGGTLIVGENGASEVYTASALPARGVMQVEMKWKVPEGIGIFPRIFAKIDADNDLTEIHENNNKSWNFLQKSTITSIPQSKAVNLTADYTLNQNYPNPFNPTTNISYRIAVSSQVKLSVFDILGREVAVLVDEKQLAGSYQIEFKTKGLASGVYLYRLSVGSLSGEARNFVKTKKMILMK